MNLKTSYFTNTKREVKVGDEVLVEGNIGEVIEIIEPNTLKIRYTKVKKERTENWDKDSIILRNKNKCEFCGSEKELKLHDISYTRRPSVLNRMLWILTFGHFGMWRYNPFEYTPLCDKCHKLEHEKV